MASTNSFDTVHPNVGLAKSRANSRGTEIGRASCRERVSAAGDGIRDKLVTGVQTCALPISDDERCDVEFGKFGGVVVVEKRCERLSPHARRCLQVFLDHGIDELFRYRAPERRTRKVARELSWNGDRKSVV